MDTTTKNPFSHTINMRELRVKLFGKDRIPPMSEPQYHFGIATFGRWKFDDKPMGSFDYAVRPQPKDDKRHPCKHRIFVSCPVCKRWIPAGRANQHGKLHE